MTLPEAVFGSLGGGYVPSVHASPSPFLSPDYAGASDAPISSDEDERCHSYADSGKKPRQDT